MVANALPIDTELAATAALIGKLRAERDAAVARAEQAEAANRILIGELADRRPAAKPVVECCTLVQDLAAGFADTMRLADETLAQKLNDHWRIENISVVSYIYDARQSITRVVTLTRSAPQPLALTTTPSRFIRVATPLPSLRVHDQGEHPLSPTAQVLFEEMRAESDARIEAAAPLSATSKLILGIVS